MPPSSRRYHPARPHRGPFHSRPLGHFGNHMRYHRPQPHHPRRGHYRKNVPTPKTSEFTVIFPKNSNGFDTKEYNPTQNDNRISIEEINKVLNEVLIAREPWNKKFWRALWCYLIFIVLAIGGFVALCIFVLTKVFALLIAGIMIFIVLMLATLVCAIIFLAHYENQEIDASKKVIDKYNPSIANKGLRWNLPAHFPKWIELWNDFRVSPHLFVQANQPQNTTSKCDNVKPKDNQENIQNLNTVDSDHVCIPVTRDEI